MDTPCYCPSSREAEQRSPSLVLQNTLGCLNLSDLSPTIRTLDHHHLRGHNVKYVLGSLGP
jgi:hypothetical protein